MKTKYARIIIVSICVVLTGISSDVFAATINVPADYATIQAAIGAANDGDVINIASGTYTEAGIEVNKSVAIQGQGESLTIVQAHTEPNKANVPVFGITGGMVTIKDMMIRHGSGWDHGGISNEGTMTLTNCTVSDNRGNGIVNRGNMTLTNCTVHSNGGEAEGGIRNGEGGTMVLTNCSVSGNNSGLEPGGIGNAGTMTLTNCTISNNSSDVGGAGGIGNGGTMTLTNCTVTNNAGVFGGGIRNEDGTVSIKNTLIADNTGEWSNDVGGTITSLDYNLIGDISGAIIEGIITHNIYGVDPMLLPLADKGGVTQTCALQEGSPAINAGTDEGAPATDQRGYGRVGAVDIGAYESGGVTSAGPASWGRIKAQFQK